MIEPLGLPRGMRGRSRRPRRAVETAHGFAAGLRPGEVPRPRVGSSG